MVRTCQLLAFVSISSCLTHVLLCPASLWTSPVTVLPPDNSGCVAGGNGAGCLVMPCDVLKFPVFFLCKYEARSVEVHQVDHRVSSVSVSPVSASSAWRLVSTEKKSVSIYVTFAFFINTFCLVGRDGAELKNISSVELYDYKLYH